MEFRASHVGLALGLAALTYIYLKVSDSIYNWVRAYIILRNLPRPRGTGVLGSPPESLTPRRHAMYSGLNSQLTPITNLSA